jgi:hypothetical protein
VTLDDRARQAAAGVKESVNSAQLLLLDSGVPGMRNSRQPTVRTRALAFAGAFAIVVVFVGLSLLPGRLFAPDENVAGNPGDVPATVTTATTTPVTEPDGSTPTTVPGDQAPAVAGAPILHITAPIDGEAFTVERVTFRGTVDPGSRVFARTPNLDEAPVDEDGNWSIDLIIQAPATTARFFAEGPDGKRSQDVSVTVTYTPPSPDTTLLPGPPEDEPSEGTTSDGEQSTSEVSPPAVTFSAAGAAADDDPQARVYSGTATPGDRILVSSEYGQGGARADERGRWTIRVPFRDAPAGVSFRVTVENVNSGGTFDFDYPGS